MAVAHAMPIDVVHALTHKAVKTRIRPRVRARCQRVLDRVVMNVIAMSGEVLLVADSVLPEAALPDATPAVLGARGTDRLFGAAACEPCLREFLFDERQSDRESGSRSGSVHSVCK